MREYIAEKRQTVGGSSVLIVPKGDLIRCKDCVYYRPYSDGKYDCDNMLGMADAYEDGFCSRAERREE